MAILLLSLINHIICSISIAPKIFCLVDLAVVLRVMNAPESLWLLIAQYNEDKFLLLELHVETTSEHHMTSVTMQQYQIFFFFFDLPYYYYLSITVLAQTLSQCSSYAFRSLSISMASPGVQMRGCFQMILKVNSVVFIS